MAKPSIHSSSAGSWTVVARIMETIAAMHRIIIVISPRASNMSFQNGVGGGGSTLFLPNACKDF